MSGNISLTPQAIQGMRTVVNDLTGVIGRYSEGRLGTDPVPVDLRVVRGAQLLLATILAAFAGHEAQLDVKIEHKPAGGLDIKQTLADEEVSAAQRQKELEVDDVLWLDELASEAERALDDADYYRGGMMDAPDPARLRKIANLLDAARPPTLRKTPTFTKDDAEAVRGAFADSGTMTGEAYGNDLADRIVALVNAGAPLTAFGIEAHLSCGDECDCERCERP